MEAEIILAIAIVGGLIF